jgi:hypothetical protein
VIEALLRCRRNSRRRTIRPYAPGHPRFRERLPGVPRVALFETAFYQWVPEYATRYAVPQTWHEAGVRRYGFHGASHKFIAERSAELLGRDDIAGLARRVSTRMAPSRCRDAPLRVISCHLGGQLDHRHLRRRGHRHQHGAQSAVRAAPEQSRG